MNEIKISSENKYNIDDDLILFKFSNFDSDSKSVFFETQTNFIQFHFCLKGECNFIYNKGSYCLPLKNEVSILLYNPINPLPVDVIIESEIYNPGDIGKVLINKVENNKVFGKIINPQIQ